MLVRHYREQHYEQIPPDIFGPSTFTCKRCEISFKRKEHLYTHYTSRMHIQMEPDINPIQNLETVISSKKRKLESENKCEDLAFVEPEKVIYKLF